MYYKFYNKIKFEKSIEYVARKSIKSDIEMDFTFKEENNIDREVIDGIIYLLSEYAENLLNKKESTVNKEKSPQVVINNNNTANASANNNVNIDISTIIEQAK